MSIFLIETCTLRSWLVLHSITCIHLPLGPDTIIGHFLCLSSLTPCWHENGLMLHLFKTFFSGYTEFRKYISSLSFYIFFPFVGPKCHLAVPNVATKPNSNVLGEFDGGVLYCCVINVNATTFKTYIYCCLFCLLNQDKNRGPVPPLTQDHPPWKPVLTWLQ